MFFGSKDAFTRIGKSMAGHAGIESQHHVLVAGAGE
jgi:hypothetical protein